MNVIAAIGIFIVVLPLLIALMLAGIWCAMTLLLEVMDMIKTIKGDDKE